MGIISFIENSCTNRKRIIKVIKINISINNSYTRNLNNYIKFYDETVFKLIFYSIKLNETKNIFYYFTYAANFSFSFFKTTRNGKVNVRYKLSAEFVL